MLKFANGIITKYNYNADKNCQRIITATTAGEALLDYTYTYDENGNRTSKKEQYQYDQAGNRALKKYGTAENFQTGSYMEEHYTYDNRNRLLVRSNPQNVTYYQYDSQGNNISELTKRFLKTESTKTQNSGTTTITTSMAQTEVEQYKTYKYDSFNKTARVVVEKYRRNFYEYNK